MKKLNSPLALLLLGIFSASLSCGGKSKSNSNKGSHPEQVTSDDKVLLLLEDAKEGLTILLSEGKTGGAKAPQNRVAPAENLSEGKTKALLARMPSLVVKKDDRASFAFRERSLPAPRTGKTVKQIFPPPVSAGTAPSAGGSLEVSRFAPEGQVPIAPHLSVSFSQPMVAVSSHAETLKTIPVKLTPQPAGKWRWIGTKTLLFDPEVRMPMATEYQVEIPSGLKSVNGDVLSKKVAFQFATPALQMQRNWPSNGPQDLDPLIFVAFDQRIDPDAVLAKLEVKAKGRAYPLRHATEEEIKEDKIVFAMVEAERKREAGRRYLVARPTEKLPKDTLVTVTVGKGSPSAEGPRLTNRGQSFNFRTYGPLKIKDSRCAWDRRCPPGSAFNFEMSNALDEELFDDVEITVEPELLGMRATMAGNMIVVHGRSQGRTSYEVTLPATLTDRFGQTLGKNSSRTFRVGDAEPQLFGPNGLTVADPSARTPSFDVHSINVRSLSVQIYKVSPSDWEAYGRFMRRNPRRPQPAPGTKVFDKNIKLNGDADAMMDTAIDLTPALNKEGKGHAVVVVEPTNWPNRWRPRLQSWVQVTDIGLDAFTDSTEMLAWVTRLSDGKPLDGVDVSITHTSQKTRSDAKGLATMDLPKAAAKQGEHQLVLATRGSDTAILPRNTYFWSDSSGFQGSEQNDQMQWFVFDDRGMYKPGEKVNISGWMRTYQSREGGDIAGISGVQSLSYEVFGSRGNKIGTGKAKLSPTGGFELSFALPKTANLGYGRVELTATGTALPGNTRTSHGFQIQEFRRPEFEVSSEASQGPHIVGKGADVSISAKYYAGGPLAGADVAWSVHSTPTIFTPPNQEDYSFGSWVPWWGWGRYGGPSSATNNWQNFQGKTDVSGKHVLHMDFVAVKPPRPMSVVANGSVTDVNRQAWATSSTILVHPSELYIGLKRDRYFVNKGEPIRIEGVIVDQEGVVASGQKGTVRAVRMDWEFSKGEYTQVERDPQTCEVEAGKDPFECEFKTPEGGTYKITATVTDAHGRPNQSEVTTWVSGGKQPPNRKVSQELATLIPDKKEYAAGDTAKIMVQSPFYPAEAVLSIRRSGIVQSRSFHMKEATTTLEVPIEEGHVPNLFVQVDIVGSAVRVDDQGNEQAELPRRPAYARGALQLSVPPTRRTLEVRVTPEHDKVQPGAAGRLSVEVLDANGKAAAGAELTAIVVDEAVLALSGYETPDPIATFYRQRGAGVTDYHQRQWLQLAEPDLNVIAATGSSANAPVATVSGGMEGMADSVAEEPSAERAPGAGPPKARRELRTKSAESAGGDKDRVAAAQGAIAVRKNFAALAAFAPMVKTDARGRATVDFKVPDNLTRYRIMVVAAAAENHFGKGESSLTARMPLMVRPSPPRFLNFGDRFELPVVLQNQTDEDMSVEVALRATNAAITKGAGRKLKVPANDRVEVRFPAEAEMAGVARFQVAASSGLYRDANEFSLPVWTPATTEAFATYGEIDKGAVGQAVRMPADVVEEFGGLDISLSSTQLQALTDAFLYLVQYPYECSEQTASRIMGVAALRDVLSAFEADGMPSAEEIVSTVKRDIERLSSLQNWDGGFAFWVRGHESWPYISIHAAHALTRAGAKGFDVPPQMLERSKQYLRQIESHIPSYYSLRTRRMLISYALYVRKRMGDLDLPRAKRLFKEAGLKGLTMESIGWLMSVLSGDSASKGILSQMHRHLDNKVSETAGAANWVDAYADDAHLVLHSSRRADAVLLESLIEDKEKSDLIPKVVRGLLAHRKRGTWANTQENVFVLLAMDEYFQTYEKTTPSFVARMWLGDQYAGEQAFRGRSTDRFLTQIPMQLIAKMKGDQKLVISKEGKGRLYYRVGMTYAPEDLKLEPADHGFAVQRIYEAVDDEGDVKRLKDGSWKIKAGAQVRVRLTMVAENRRYHVALVDALPAGLEPMNPALAVTGVLPQDPQAQTSGGDFWWWRRSWFEHQNMRDERVEAFASLLWAGVHNYSYVTRATTPGTFVVPPAKAEEMYMPETFGRSASDVLIVE